MLNNFTLNQWTPDSMKLLKRIFLELKEVGASEVNGQWVHTFYYIQIRSELLETLKRIYTTYVFGMLLCLYFPLILNHVMSFILIHRIISDLLILIKNFRTILNITSTSTGTIIIIMKGSICYITGLQAKTVLSRYEWRTHSWWWRSQWTSNTPQLLCS